MTRRSWFRTLSCAAVVITLASACSQDATSDDASSSSQGAASSSSVPASTSSTMARPAGPAASLSEIDAPGEPFVGAAIDRPLDELGYTQTEYVASGTATSYQAQGALDPDGAWTFAPADTAEYRTRILVRRPADPADFSGTVVLEWLNVSGGVDAGPGWSATQEEMTRQGHIWVGVSAQKIGVEGGPVLVTTPISEGIAGKGLKTLDPKRYNTLAHPGDGFSFDIFTQVARAVRAGGDVLGGAEPTAVIASGQSQSAIALITYVNGVQPLTRAFDGFFVHSRAYVALPLVAPGEFADLAGGITANAPPVLLRGDLGVPILELQAEGDVTSVLKSVAARQPDTDGFRLWEVAGTAHADQHLLGRAAEGIDCGARINNAPMHVVVKAALRALVDWVAGAGPPPSAPRLEVTDAAEPALVRDADGIVEGGIRTPPVDVPVEVLSGAPGSNPDLICILLGSTAPLPAARLAQRYASRAEYERAYADATDAAIAGGWALEEDRDALMGFAQPDLVAG